MFTQAEADELLALEKHCVKDASYSYPGPGIEISIPLVSVDRREEFLLDIRRHRIELARAGKYQTRARGTWPIARLDFGRPHTNPDGAKGPAPHLHVYREGWGLRWAFALDPSRFTDPDDRWILLNDFMQYCNITRVPVIQQDAFA